MTEAQHLSYAVALSGALFVILMGVISWAANKVYDKLSELTETMQRYLEGHHAIDKRVTTIEEICKMRHRADASVQEFWARASS